MRRRTRATLSGFTLALLASVAVFASRSSSAQTPDDKATAQALFDEARDLSTQGKDAEACPKFAESQRLDPSLGTLLRLATCYEKIGKTASAWALYGEAIAGAKASGQTARENYATEHATALEPKLSKLTINVPPSSEVAGIEVRRDGKSLARAQWGTAVPIDPGSISIEASAPGKVTWKTSVSLVGEGKHEVVAVPALLDAPSSVVPSTPVDAPSRSNQRVIGLVVGAVGVVGLAIGSIYGLRAMSRNSDSAPHCRTATLCDGEGLALRDDARGFATISTIAFIGGGVALAGGAVLVLTAKPSGATVTVGLGSVPATGSAATAGMWLSGRW